MSRLKQTRDPDLSLWQSAVDEVVAKTNTAANAHDGGGTTTSARPDTSHPMVQAAAADVAAEESKESLQSPTALAPAKAEAALDVVKYCSNVARKLAVAIVEGDKAQEAICRAQIGKFTVCDAGWMEPVEKYVAFKLAQGTIPYRVYTNIDQFVIDGKLPNNAKVAIVGDWGTGQDVAKNVLAQIRRKSPDVVIHLGDIYYSGTAFEVDQYFYQIWNTILDLSKTPTFTLAGNHDMFSGGAPYYALIDKLGQPASYFCLRNDNWQFVAVDTGLHDCKPGCTDPTFLEDTEIAWLQRRLDQAQGRRSILLSHHQLFSAFESIGATGAVNEKLNAQIGPLLSKIAIWIWGHEHNLVIYKKQLGILARCVGHGAFPVGMTEVPDQPPHPEIAMEDFRLAQGEEFYAHGYAMVELNGKNAKVSYYQDTDENNAVFVDNL